MKDTEDEKANTRFMKRKWNCAVADWDSFSTFAHLTLYL